LNTFLNLNIKRNSSCTKWIYNCRW